MIYQIIRCISRIGKSVLCAGLHDILVKGHGRDHAGKQRQTSFYSINCVKGQFFILLHIFIICQRDSFHRRQHGHQSTINTAALSTNQLCNIRILLLRHDAASGAVRIIDLHKPILIGIPDDDLLTETAQMHGNDGQGA